MVITVNRTFLVFAALSALIAVACSKPGQAPQGKAAQAPSAPLEKSATEKLQVIVDKTSQGRFQIAKSFDLPGSGLHGLVLENKGGGGDKVLVWAPSSGDYLMPGPLFDKDGTNLSETMLAEHAGFITVDQLATASAKAGFVAGSAGPIVTVFFEPYCGWCQKLFEQMRPMIDNGQIRARFVMVGFLRPDSQARAAAIESASKPYAALTAWETTKDKTAAATPQVSEQAIAAINENTNLMRSAGQSGTPALVICKKDGSGVELIKGMPGDFSQFAKNVGDKGHPSCAN